MAATGQQRNEPPSGTALSDPVVTLEDSSAPHAAGASGPAAAVATGDCLAGRFVIEKELGRGAGGTVFVARDRMLDRPVAIKILNHAPDAEALARFAQ